MMNLELSEMLSVLLIRYELAANEFIADRLISAGITVDGKTVKKDYRVEKDSIVTVNGKETLLVVSTVSGQFPVTSNRHEYYKTFGKGESSSAVKSEPKEKIVINYKQLHDDLSKLLPTGSKLFDNKIGFCVREIERVLVMENKSA